MGTLSEQQRESKMKIVNDESVPIEERKKLYKEVVNSIVNPKAYFNPATFDINDDGSAGYEAMKRPRVAPPERLFTGGLLPKEIVEGQLVGECESKQDLYLTMAYYINSILDRVEYLESEILKIKNK